jgi:N-acetylglucosaminyldiphosphoundecaprenol N-acetyl-beta-D-mannosaminyltransferase
MTDGAPESISILGIQVSAFDSYDHAVDVIRKRLYSRVPTFCVAINSEKVHRAGTDPVLRHALESADIRLCDGVGVSLASMLLYRRRLVRCTGIDLFPRLIGLAEKEGWKVFLLGASSQSNHAACRALLSAYPNLRLVGGEDGYFKNSASIVARINESRADLLFVGLGSPRQEKWIIEQMPRLEPPFKMGIGGTLDVLGGAAKRAPLIIQRTGTEWLFRLVLQPSRFRRQTALPLFTLGVLRDMPLWRSSVALSESQVRTLPSSYDSGLPPEARTSICAVRVSGEHPAPGAEFLEKEPPSLIS